MAETPSLPHQQLVESLLGEKLFRGNAKPVEATDGPEGRQDVRLFAHAATVNAIQNILGEREFAQQPPLLSDPAREVVMRKAGNDFGALSRMVAIANNLSEATFQLGESSDPRHQARAQFQSGMLEAFRHHTQTVRHAPAHSNLPITECLRDAILGIAPTGSGKTVIEACELRGAGISKPAGLSRKPLRALVVLPDQALMLQYSGAMGDKTFLNFLGPQASVSSYWEKEKDVSGDVVLVTKHSLPRLFEKGLLSPEDIDIAVLDEAHAGLGPQMLQRLGTLGTRLFCLTATPAYSPDRDLRHLLSHVETGSLQSFIKEGILNPAQLYTYHSDHNAAEIARNLAIKYIQEGRKVVVYCHGKSKQSQKVTAMVNAHFGKTVAQAVGSFQGKENFDYQVAYHQGTLRCLSTIRMLREGWDADVDAVIIIGPNVSLLELTQKVGRAMRPGNFQTIIAEIQPPPSPAHERRRYSIWNVFGLEHIRQGYEITPDSPAQKDYEMGNPHALQNPAFHEEKSFYGDIEAALHNALAPNVPVREILMAPASRNYIPPEGHFELEALARSLNVPPTWLQLKLDEASIPYVGVWPREDTGQFERWYAPMVQDYLARNSLPTLAHETHMHLSAISNMTGVSFDYLQVIVNRLGLQPDERLTASHQSALHYDLEQIARILKEIDKIPVAKESDVVFSPLAKELGHSFASTWCRDNNILLVEKRRNPVHGISGFALHISREDADCLREARAKLCPITQKDITIAQIAERADLSATTVRSLLSDDEQSRVYSRRQEGIRVHIVDCMTLADGMAVVERLRPVPLPPDFVPLALIEMRVPAARIRITKWMKKHNFLVSQKRIKGPNKIISCYSWDALISLEKALGRREGIEPLDTKLLVRSPDETNALKWGYTQSIQAIYVTSNNLAAMPSPLETFEPHKTDSPFLTSPEGEPLAFLAFSLHCTPAAMRVIFQLTNVQKEEMFAPKPHTPITHISKGAASRVTQYVRQSVPSANHLEAWISHQRLTDITQMSSEELSAVVNSLRPARSERRVRRQLSSAAVIDVYYDPKLAHRIICFCESRRKAAPTQNS